MKNKELTLGQKLSDKITNFIGSWRGFLLHIIIIGSWITFNSVSVTSLWHFDKFPFIFLNLALSTEAAIAACFILMSQNRQSDIDRKTLIDSYLTDLETKLLLQEIIERLDHVDEQKDP